MPSFSQTQWTSCKRWSLEWAAPTGTQPWTVFGYKDFCRSTVLGTLESVGMNGQIDWQAQQCRYHIWSAAWQGRGSPRLEELSQHGQARALQHWPPEGKRSGERKRRTFHPPRSRTICVQPGKYWHCSRATLGRLLRDGAECVWAFLSTMMPSWAGTEIETETDLTDQRPHRNVTFAAEIVSPTSVSTATSDAATIEQTRQPGCTPMIKLDRQRLYTCVSLSVSFSTSPLSWSAWGILLE